MNEKGRLEQATPILPSRDLNKTATFYTQKLGFKQTGSEHPGYLMIQRDNISLHFFLAENFDPTKDAGMCYVYVSNVEALYLEYQASGVIHPNGALEHKPWGMYEFAVLDPDNNLLRIGQAS
ncbi:MAG TPA: VOC family protein [Chloroflexia bacterium]|nr:VOC family protein [Chloroflexia bacterium]